MTPGLLNKLFYTQAQCAVIENAELLKKEVSFPKTWEEYFSRVHDLKAQALAAGLAAIAKDLHKLEDLLWAKQDQLSVLKTAQAELEAWFRPSTLGETLLPIKEVLNLLAEQAIKQGTELGKSLDVRVITEGLSLNDLLVPELYPSLVHLIHNALTHGVGATGMMWLHAFHENWHLVIEVEDDGGEKKSEHTVTSMLSGRGVGLASIRSNMKRLKGEFTLEESKRGGTKARLRIPIPRTDRKVG